MTCFWDMSSDRTSLSLSRARDEELSKINATQSRFVDRPVRVREPAHRVRKTRNANDRSPVRSRRFPSNKIRARAIAGLFLPRPDSSSCPRNDFSGGSPGVRASLSSSASTSGRRSPTLPARLSFSRQLRCKNVIKGVRARKHECASAHIMKVDGDRRHGRCEWMTPEGHGGATCSRALHARTRARASVASLRALLYEGVFFSRKG